MNTRSSRTAGAVRARVVSGLSGLAGVAIVVWAGLPLLSLTYLGLSIVAINELAKMLKLRGIDIHRKSLIVAAILTLPVAIPPSHPLGLPTVEALDWRIVITGVLLVYLVAVELWRPSESPIEAIVYSLFSFLYVPLLLSFLITLRFTPNGVDGLYTVSLVLLATFATDVGAYMLGSLFGRHKLIPAVSPNKTVEGALGGILFPIAFIFTLYHGVSLVVEPPFPVWQALVVTVVVAVAGQLGDLFASLIKRWVGVKDTGQFLPGHGGVLDRIDSTLITLPIGYFVVTLFLANGSFVSM